MGKTSKTPKLVPMMLGVHNLTRLYAKADMYDRQEGKSYYKEFGARVCHVAWKYGDGVTSKQACGVYAALSPNNTQEGNLRDMAKAVHTWYHEPQNYLHIRLQTYGANKAKALRILRGEDPDIVLKGRKTNSFYHNLLNPSLDYVTVDGHMVNAWNNIKVPLNNAGITDTEYLKIKNGIKTVAQYVGLSPPQLQAILWLAWRRINRVLWKGRNMELDLQECG